MSVLECFFQARDDVFLDCSRDRNARLAIGAHDELAVRDDARLGCRTTRVVNDQAAILGSEFAQLSLQSLAWTILTDHANYRSTCTKSDEVCEHIRGAAEVNRLATHIDNRHRRFGRDARYVAPHKLVEHHVAEDEDI